MGQARRRLSSAAGTCRSRRGGGLASCCRSRTWRSGCRSDSCGGRCSDCGEGMNTYRIAVIAGDGIGQDVTPAAMAVLDASAKRAGFTLAWQEFPWGSQHYLNHGRMMPENALDLLRPFDAILFGAVGDPRIQDNVT